MPRKKRLPQAEPASDGQLDSDALMEDADVEVSRPLHRNGVDGALPMSVEGMEEVGEDFDLATPTIEEAALEGDGEGYGAEALLREMFSTKNIHMKSDVPAEAIPDLVEMMGLALKYRAKDWIRELAIYFQVRLSKDRESRKEGVSMYKGAQEREMTLLGGAQPQ